MNYEETGRPRVYEGASIAMQAVTLRMHVWHLRVAELYGKGNISDGVRITLEKLAENDRMGIIPMPRRVKPC